MKLEEVLPLLREGKKITRKDWKLRFIELHGLFKKGKEHGGCKRLADISEEDSMFVCRTFIASGTIRRDNSEMSLGLVNLTSDDILADDWEVIEVSYKRHECAHDEFNYLAQIIKDQDRRDNINKLAYDDFYMRPDWLEFLLIWRHKIKWFFLESFEKLKRKYKYAILWFRMLDK